MTTNWMLVGISLGLFIISCAFPLLARKQEDKFIRAYYATTDAILTVASIIVGLLAFKPFWAAFGIMIAFHVSGSAAYYSVLGDEVNPYTRKPYKGKRGVKQEGM